MPGGKGTVLVVDDDPDHRMVMRTLLEDADVDLLEACNGLEALEVRSQAPMPLLVLCDHRMPGPTGIQTLQKMAAKRRSGERFVLMSSLVDDAMLHEALATGTDDVVEKPLLWEDLLVVVRRLVADWRASPDYHAMPVPMPHAVRRPPAR